MGSETPKRASLVWCFIGSNIVALGAGTPYLFSFYGPQLLAKCHLPVSELSTLSLSLNIGSALLGFFAGMVIDRNVKLSCLIGAIATFAAYSILGYCYVHESSNLTPICFGLALVGFGSVSGFYAAVKCCTTNFPHHRGTAGAFPVALYALAGMLFSFICTKLFGDEMDKVFKFLTYVCSSMLFIGCLTLSILVKSSHKKAKRKDSNHFARTPTRPSSSLEATRPIDIQGRGSGSQIGSSAHYRSSIASSSSNSSVASSFQSIVSGIRSPSFVWSKELTGSLSFWGWGKVREPDAVDTIPGMRAMKLPGTSYSSTAIPPQAQRRESFPQGRKDSFIREDPTIPVLPPVEDRNGVAKDTEVLEMVANDTEEGFWANSHLVQTVRKPRFIGYFLLLATLQGIGQMYIYSVGFIVRTQIASTPASEGTLNAEEIQSIQVSIISVLSFFGRLSSGPVSDFLIKKLNAQRLWNIVLAAALMTLACFQMLNQSSELSDYAASSMPRNINNISRCSAIFGFAFGILFGTFPPMIADSFGTDGFSSIWGLTTSGGLFTVKLFCAILGSDLSRNTPSGRLYCDKGVLCYSHTFNTVAICSVAAMVLAIFIIAITHIRRNRMHLMDGELNIS